MKPFITDTHRTSVQGYLCFFPPRLISHAFFQSVCVRGCVWLWNPKEPLCPYLSFDHPPDPLRWLTSPLSNRVGSLRPPAAGAVLFCRGVLRIPKNYFSLDFFEVSLDACSLGSTDTHVHIRVRAIGTQTLTHLLIFPHTTRALSPLFAFPTVHPCQALWQPNGFLSILSLQWQPLCPPVKHPVDICVA